MAIRIATATLAAINAAIFKDGGGAFRELERVTLPQMGDAYRGEEDSFRSHLGASVIGKSCERAVWYAWRWVENNRPSGKRGEDPIAGYSRMVRLWNRGHLEEGRFLALLMMIGVKIYQQDATGEQFGFREYGGHFSGHCDGVGIGFPDIPQVPALTEYKTHSDETFKELIRDGVRISKPEHYIQMTEYMGRLSLQYAVYFAINKNTEALHAEIIEFDPDTYARVNNRARRIIFGGNEVPPRILHASPGWVDCKLCSAKEVCYGATQPLLNCRTCQAIEFRADGTTVCRQYSYVLSKEEQMKGCRSHIPIEVLGRV